MGAQTIAAVQFGTGFRVYLLAGAIIAGVALGFAAPSHAAPATAAAAAESDAPGRPVKLNAFNKRSTKPAVVVKRQTARKQAAKTAAVNATYATKRGAKYSSIASRVQKASQKFQKAPQTADLAAAETAVPAKPPQPRTPSTVSTFAGDSLKPLVADALAEMSAADLKAAGVSAPLVVADAIAPEASVQVAAADQLNDIDRAAAAANENASGRPGQILKPVSPQRAAVASTDSTWDQTSWIGKLFVAFGGLLTLASAARMFMA